MGNDRNSYCLSIYLIYYLFSGNTILFLLFIALFLNNSYVLRYIFIEKQEKKNGGKKRKEGRKKERKVLSETRIRHPFGSVATSPNRYTTKADCGNLVKTILFNAFPMENPLAYDRVA